MSVSVIPKEIQHTCEGETERDHKNGQTDQIFTVRLQRGLRRGDGSEPFLPCSVPDLEFNSFSVNLHCADLKVHSDSGYVTSCEERKSMILHSVITFQLEHCQASIHFHFVMDMRTQQIKSFIYRPFALFPVFLTDKHSVPSRLTRE